jgi:hypothetical protein
LVLTLPLSQNGAAIYRAAAMAPWNTVAGVLPRSR